MEQEHTLFASPRRAPLVSVAMTSFNSERWIARALDSVLQQETSFDVEIVVGDDHSSDSTTTIIQQYRERHPEKFVIPQRTKRLGMQRNYMDTFDHCGGNYIAWLDADDYWTDPQKLHFQVELLESDHSISACGHFVRQVMNSGMVRAHRVPSTPPGRYGIEALIRKNIVPSPSIVFRNGIQRTLPPWFFELSGLVDWPILLAAAKLGDVVLIDRVMADYVLHPESAYMGKGALYQESIDLEFCERMGEMLPSSLQGEVRASIGKRCEAIAWLLSKAGRWRESRMYARRALSTPDLLDNLRSKASMIAKCYIGTLVSMKRFPGSSH